MSRSAPVGPELAHVGTALKSEASPKAGSDSLRVLGRAFCGMAARLALAMGLCASLAAQDNYEIQVYGSDTVAPGDTMVELHSNFTADGSTASSQGVHPTKHAFHETLEVTHGFTDWFETGAYVFTSARSPDGWSYVGSHLRPRARAPDSWGWPVGASLSAEVGFQHRSFSADTWTLELRPIIDNPKHGRFYWSLNPSLDLALKGVNRSRGLEFAPNAKLSWDVIKAISVGLEYYGSLGPLSGFDPSSQQQHQLFPSLDLNLSPEWEVNLGYGFGLTPSTDHRILKLILGRRFGRSGRGDPGWKGPSRE
ncbi:MAG TPA: transporter [Vicinamibacteria bacterium]|nr:transporter [Vicinamibacteria bacterium]